MNPTESRTSSSPVMEAPNQPARDTDLHKHSTTDHKPLKTRHKVPPDAGFILTERIGKGSFATVYKGEWGGDLLPKSAPVQDIRKSERITVAVKVVQRSHLKKDKRLMDIFESEMGILKQMKHPHIVHLIDVVQTANDFNLIMEYCAFGDLSGFIRRQHHLSKKIPAIADTFSRYPSPENGLNPVLVRHFLAQLASSLGFLRKHDIVHRDVKPQNLLIMPGALSIEEARSLGYAGSWELPVIKIADFGFARFLPSSSMAETLCGSPLYMAPEILNYEKYNAKADLWSVGAVTYEMVTGKPPFPAANHMELIKKIDKSKNNINIPAEVESDLQDIIRGLLKRSPDERISFEDFFERTAWSNANDNAGTSRLVDDNNASSVSDVLGSSQNSSMSDSLKNSSGDSKTANSRGKPGSIDFFSRRDSNDIAVESPSPSPESSQVAVNKEPVTGRKDGKLTNGDSENDYVFIEKRTVEVNSLADDLQSPVVPRRRLTNPEKKPRTRRLSSIAYGASPTSALAQALLKSSSRLFGAKADTTGSNLASTNSASASLPAKAPFSVTLTTPKSGEKRIIDELEQLATIAKIVILYADIKYSQVETDNGNSDSNSSFLGADSEAEKLGRYLRSGSTNKGTDFERSSLRPLHSPPSHIDPYSQLELANESLVLHLKALSILAYAMNVASEWWEQYQLSEEPSNASPGINSLVQWIRDKFNECIEHAEEERSVVIKLKAELSATDTAAHKSNVSAERLLFERALEMAKVAAVQEMGVSSKHEDGATEAVTACEMNYGTAVWMLKALLISEKPEDALADDDRAMVETLMAKIAQRLGALKRKVLSGSTSQWNSQGSSPSSQSSLRSIRMSGKHPYSQLTPP